MENVIVDSYAKKIYAHVAEMFNEESENYIDLSKVIEDNEATEMMYALANLVPTLIYKHLTGEEVDVLGFNHIMNRLICQNKAE